jgi:hypothetical protein
MNQELEMQAHTLSNSSDGQVENLRKAIKTLESLLEEVDDLVLYNDFTSALDRCRTKLENLPKK